MLGDRAAHMRELQAPGYPRAFAPLGRGGAGRMRTGGGGPAGSSKGPRLRASPESRESCSSRRWLEHGRRCWRLRGPRGQAAGVPASLTAASHPALVVSYAGLEESVGVLPGGVAG